MASEKFWILQPAFSEAAERKTAEWNFSKSDQVWSPTEPCPLNPEHRGLMRADKLKVRLKGGRQDDLVWTQSNECLLQRQVQDWLLSQNWGGFKLKDVEWSSRANAGDDLKLKELCRQGFGGQAVTDALALRERCEACGRETYRGDGLGFSVDLEKWDGSDFFIVWPLPKYLVVTDRVAKGLIARRFSGFGLLPTEDFVFRGTYSPGRLRDWLKPRN